MLILIGPKVGGVEDANGTLWFVDATASPSEIMNSGAILRAEGGDAVLEGDSEAIKCAIDANRRMEAIGLGGVPALTEAAGIGAAVGVLRMENSHAISDFVANAESEISVPN